MKTCIFILLLLTQTIFSFAKNTETNEKDDLSDKVRESIEEMISYPDLAKKNKLEGVVVVDFTLTQSGKAQINAINSSHEEFKQHVIQELNILNKEADKELIGKSFKYKFVFIRK